MLMLMNQGEMFYSCCEGVHVFLQEVNSLIDPGGDGGENHVETGLRAETRGHLDHSV